MLNDKAMNRYKQNSIDSYKQSVNSKTLSKKWDEYVKQFEDLGLTAKSSPLPSKKSYISQNLKSRDKNIKRIFDSPSFPYWYESSVKKAIKDVNVKILKKDKALVGGTVGQYNPSTNVAKILSKQPNRDITDAGVHEIKHAVQSRMMDNPNMNIMRLDPSTTAMPSGQQGPYRAIKNLIDKNLVDIPSLGSKRRPRFNYLKDPEEVSARLEELRLLKNRPGKMGGKNRFDELKGQGKILEAIGAEPNVKTGNRALDDLIEIFGSSSKVFDLEKAIWGLAPIGISSSLLGDVLETEQ